MSEKSGLLFLLKYLHDDTNEKKMKSVPELQQELKAKGYASDPRTIRKDLQLLKNVGFDIQEEGEGIKGDKKKYYYGSQDWDRTDARILIDAVSAAMFLTNKKTEQLVKKLSALPGLHMQEELTPKVYVSAHVKAENEHILYIIDAVTEAIQQGKKITFQMQNYNTDKERVARRGGQTYIVSPYDTVWCDDRYYMIGWSDNRNMLVHMRIDRMTIPKIEEEDAVPKPDSYNVQDYAGKITRMFGGARREVTIRCRRGLEDNVIDKFGLDAPFSNLTEDTFDVTEEVAVSGTFLSWLFQYAGNMMIVGPEDVRELYFRMLKAATDDLIAGAMSPDAEKYWRLEEKEDKEKHKSERDDRIRQRMLSRLGAVIATRRNRKGWSQEQLAEMTGIDVEIIRKAETNPEQALDDQTLQLLSDTLKLNYDYLLQIKEAADDARPCFIPGRGKRFASREEYEEMNNKFMTAIDLFCADLEAGDGIDESGIY